MNPDTAELAIADPARELASPAWRGRADARSPGPGVDAPRPRARADAARRAAGLGRGLARAGARERPCAIAGARCGARDCWSGRSGVGDARRPSASARAPCLQPARADARLRLARRPAGRAGGALGRVLVPRDRALRLPPRPRRASPPRATPFFPLYPLGLRAARLARRCRSIAGRRAALAAGASRSRCTGSTASRRSSWRAAPGGAPARPGSSRVGSRTPTWRAWP